MEARNLRKERTGIVLSNKMDKTITVAAKFKEKHPIYGKFVSKTKKYHAHDEKNECNVGKIGRIDGDGIDALSIGGDIRVKIERL